MDKQNCYNMTYQEAINIIRDNCNVRNGVVLNMALDKAIEALESMQKIQERMPRERMMKLHLLAQQTEILLNNAISNQPDILDKIKSTTFNDEVKIGSCSHCKSDIILSNEELARMINTNKCNECCHKIIRVSHIGTQVECLFRIDPCNCGNCEYFSKECIECIHGTTYCDHYQIGAMKIDPHCAKGLLEKKKISCSSFESRKNEDV